MQSRVIKLPAISRNTVCMFLAFSNCRIKHSYFKPGPRIHKALVGMTTPIVKQVCDFKCCIKFIFFFTCYMGSIFMYDVAGL